MNPKLLDDNGEAQNQMKWLMARFPHVNYSLYLKKKNQPQASRVPKTSDRGDFLT